MGQEIRSRLNYANVTATVALFVALGGGAWAALGKDSVGSKELKKDAVRSKEVKDEALKASDIRNGAIGGDELGDGSVGATEIADGGVGSAEVADGAVSGADVADGGLAGADVGADALGGDQIDEATLGQVSDAGELDGRDFAAGSGQTDATSAQTIVSLPALGAQIRTDGDADTAFEIALRNNGSDTLSMVCPDSAATVLPTGTAPGLPTTGARTMLCLVRSTTPASLADSALLFCADDPFANEIHCEALRA